MVCPVTNCSPIIRIAMSTPRRTTGSPPRAISRVSAWASPASSAVPVSLPVTTRPQVAALTNSDGEWPTCARQSPPPILSRISASRVARSGMRSSASARHISATPSWLDSAYSRTSPSTAPRVPFARSACTSRVANARVCAASSGANVALARSGGRQCSSGRRVASVIRARSSDCGCKVSAKAANGIACVMAAIWADKAAE